MGNEKTVHDLSPDSAHQELIFWLEGKTLQNFKVAYSTLPAVP